MDGTLTLAFTDAICSTMADPAFDHGSSSSSSSPLYSAQVELKWTLDSALERCIVRTEKDAAALTGTPATSVIKTGYGKCQGCPSVSRTAAFATSAYAAFSPT
jgi:hypothetical protein